MSTQYRPLGAINSHPSQPLAKVAPANNRLPGQGLHYSGRRPLQGGGSREEGRRRTLSSGMSAGSGKRDVLLREALTALAHEQRERQCPGALSYVPTCTSPALLSPPLEKDGAREEILKLVQVHSQEDVGGRVGWKEREEGGRQGLLASEDSKLLGGADAHRRHTMWSSHVLSCGAKSLRCPGRKHGDPVRCSQRVTHTEACWGRGRGDHRWDEVCWSFLPKDLSIHTLEHGEQQGVPSFD